MNGIISGKTEKSVVEEIITSLPKEVTQRTLYNGSTIDVSGYSGVRFINDTGGLIVFPQGKYATYPSNIGTTYQSFRYNSFTYYTSGINAGLTIDCDKQTITCISGQITLGLW